MPESLLSLLKSAAAIMRLLPRRLAVIFGVGVSTEILMLGCALILRAFVGDVPDPTLRLFLAAPFYATLVLGTVIVGVVMLLLLVALADWLGGDR